MTDNLRNRSLSPTMLAAIDLAKEGGGKLGRLPGGFWTAAGRPILSKADRHVGTTTVDALVKRGVATYSKEMGSKRGRNFPIEITLNPVAAGNMDGLR